jgi:glycosyltransferase involved in cell wall biosynthesis
VRVIVASTIVPFIEGGGTFIVDWLAQKFAEYGHSVEVLKLPFYSHYPEMLDQMLALRLLDVTQHGDRLIAIRTPSYLLRHPSKVLWVIHHHRGAYEPWGTPCQDIPNTPEGLGYQKAFFRSADVAFREAARIFTNSSTVSQKLKYFNDVDSEVLYPPLLNSARYRCDGYGDFVVYVSQGTHHHRQNLVLESLRFTKTPVRLLIAGSPDSEVELAAVAAEIERYELGKRVELLSDWGSVERGIELYSNCLAAIYIPFDGDPYGYPTLEAHHSAKCVITTHDSGGGLDWISDGENGLVTDPEPAAIAAAMDALYMDKNKAREMGTAGRAKLEALGINWNNVVTKLLS